LFWIRVNAKVSSVKPEEIGIPPNHTFRRKRESGEKETMSLMTTNWVPKTTPSPTADQDLIPVNFRKTHRRKCEEIVGVISAGQLTQRYEIPRRDFQKKTGYQREVSPARVNKLADDLKKNQVDLPTALLLNHRGYTRDRNLVEKDGRYWFTPSGQPLYVVDGQHRIEALFKLVQENPTQWSTFEVPFVCMLGATELEEMEEFYVVNSTAKSVRTDLAFDLLKQRAENDPSVYDSLLERGQAWRVEAQGVAEDLSLTPKWAGRIRFPGQEKGASTIGSSGMVGSLQDLLANPFFGSISRANRIQILDAFWKGVAGILPEAFDEPESYVVQKSTGVQVMHRIMIPVLEYLRSTGKSLITPASYEAALRGPLNELEGDTREGGVAKGVEFWRSGPEGAAGSFSSNAGRRVLTAKIRAQLPKPEVA
jgi:DGQHR domain-containing protein